MADPQLPISATLFLALLLDSAGAAAVKRGDPLASPQLGCSPQGSRVGPGHSTATIRRSISLRTTSSETSRSQPPQHTGPWGKGWELPTDQKPEGAERGRRA